MIGSYRKRRAVEAQYPPRRLPGRVGGLWLFALMILTTLLVSSPPAAAAGESGRIGRAFIEPLPVVERFEKHYRSLPAWAAAGVRGATVLHIDAHHDMMTSAAPQTWEPLAKLLERGDVAGITQAGDEFAPDHSYALNNYIVPAYQLGMVKDIWWIYPHDRAFDQEFLEQIKGFLAREQYGYFNADLDSWRLDGAYLRGTLRGIPVTLARLQDLPRFSRPVLLDIDCDYFVGDWSLQQAFSLPETMRGRLLDFRKAIAAAGIEVSVATVALSVDGDFLPSRYRYIGRLLEQWLKEPHGDPEGDPVLARFWAAEEALERNDLPQALAGLEVVAQSDSWLRSQARYDLAMLDALNGRAPQAADKMTRLANEDPEYVRGLLDLARLFARSGDLLRAKELFLKLVEFGPEWAYAAHSGVGHIYFNLGDYRSAVEHYRAALEIYPHLTNAMVLLADALFQLGSLDQAHALYSKVWQSGDDRIAQRDRNFLPNLLSTSRAAGDRKLELAVRAEINRIDPGNLLLRGRPEQEATR